MLSGLKLLKRTYLGLLCCLSRAELLVCRLHILNSPLLRDDFVRAFLGDKVLKGLETWISLRVLEEGVAIGRIVTTTYHKLLESSFLAHALVILVRCLVDWGLRKPKLKVSIPSLACNFKCWLAHFELS